MKLVILGSGRGSNARALLQSWQAGRLGKAEPVGLFCDRPDAPMLDLGKEFSLPAFCPATGPYRTKLSAEAEALWIEAIRRTGAEWVVLAGFMRVLKAPFLAAFPMRIINLHPSLLPSFKGLEAIRQAYDYGVKFTGCTVHYVTAALDGGPIIDQAVVAIDPADDLAALTAKVHAAEHALLPQVIARLSLQAAR